MMLKTDALALRVWPHSNTSQIVSWLTPGHGRISTLNKGALRSKSPLLGQCDLFYRCELIYYTRSRTDLFIAKEICALDPRSSFRSDWRASSLASYWATLVQHTSVSMASHASVFGLANEVLDELAKGTQLALVLLWGEVRLLDMLGLAPQLQQCALCHSKDTLQGFKRFSVSQGGVVCPGCAQHQGSHSIAIQADALAILRRIQNAERCIRNISPTDGQLRTMQMIVGLFQEHHLDMPPDTRTIALNAVKIDSARVQPGALA